MPKRVLSFIWNFFFGPVEAIRLRVFEVAFTFAFLCYFLFARFWYWKEWLTPNGYHYTRSAHPSYVIDPFPLLQPWAAFLFGMVTIAAAVLVLAGKFRRPALGILFASAVYIQNADALSAFALNIHYIAGFAILLVSPMKTIRGESSGGFDVIDSAWPLRILQATILIQFFTAGWCKYQNMDWVVRHDVLWSHAQGPYRNSISGWMLQNVPMKGWTLMQWGALLFELVGPFLLLVPKTRWLALWWWIGFVSFIALTMNDLIYFMLQLAAYLTLFIKAEEWHGMFRWFERRSHLIRRLRPAG